jgi:ATP-dependent exoDNAse (exonuclease V) alpha subunit
MENILNQLESKYLNFKLGEEQKEALLSIFSFIDTKGFGDYSLVGAAGTGKSTVTKLIISYLEQKFIPYQLVCPTHKAKKILANMTQREVVTIHQLLSLKPSIDIMDLDMKDLQFAMKSDNSIPQHGVIIIDECSMINDNLYDTIIQSCYDKNCKVILQGDSSQIKPVKQHTIAKTFKCTNASELTQIYRQSGQNCVRDLLDILRKKPLKEFHSQTSPDGNIYVYKEAKDLIFNTIDIFKEAVNSQNPNRIKLIAYTNKRVQAFNKCIRSHIFNQSDLPEYVKGDILFGYDNSECKGQTIENSGDYQIHSAFKSREVIGPVEMDG